MPEETDMRCERTAESQINGIALLKGRKLCFLKLNQVSDRMCIANK